MNDKIQKNDFKGQLSQKYSNVLNDIEIVALSALFDSEVIHMFGDLDKYYKKNGTNKGYEDRLVRVNILNNIAKRFAAIMINFRHLSKINIEVIRENRELILENERLKKENKF